MITALVNLIAQLEFCLRFQLTQNLRGNLRRRKRSVRKRNADHSFAALRYTRKGNSFSSSSHIRNASAHQTLGAIDTSVGIGVISSARACSPTTILSVFRETNDTWERCRPECAARRFP